MPVPKNRLQAGEVLRVTAEKLVIFGSSPDRVSLEGDQPLLRARVLLQDRMFHLVTGVPERLAGNRSFYLRIRVQMNMYAYIAYKDVLQHCAVVQTQPRVRVKAKTVWERLLSNTPLDTCLERNK